MPITIKNRYTGDTIMVVEADSLQYANLSHADLSHASLSGANLSHADLSGANLSHANLSGANLQYADLSGANLSGANLWGANLSGANLSGANLSHADLSGANLRGANLWGANLWGANLSGANLSHADLSGAVGNMREVKSAQFAEYPVAWTIDIMHIGCERHTVEEWRAFDDERIIQMDGKRALKFWRTYKDALFTLIDASR